MRSDRYKDEPVRGASDILEKTAARVKELASDNKAAKSEARLRIFGRFWAVIYLIALLAFEFALITVDILPPRLLLIIVVCLTVISIILFLLMTLRKSGIWKRLLSIFFATFLMAVYIMGVVYMFGTLSFLEFVSGGTDGDVEAMKHPFNIYVTGIDGWGEIEETGRSDVNMIMTVNPETHKILLTSIPRDYEIRLVDYDYAADKLTHTGIYGVETTISSVEDLLDVQIDYYVRVNFQTLIIFIDEIGGITVNSEYAFTSDYGGDHVEYEFHEGMNYLNGREALAFARERKSFVDGDRQRVKNQQLVMEAIIKKSLNSPSLLMKYAEILNSMKNYMQTNISSKQIRALLKNQLDSEEKWEITRNSVTGGDGELDTYSSGYAYVMLHDEESIENAKTMLQEAMAVPEEEEPAE